MGQKVLYRSNVPLMPGNCTAMMSLSFERVPVCVLGRKHADPNKKLWEIVPQKPTQPGTEFQEEATRLVAKMESSLIGQSILGVLITPEKTEIEVDSRISAGQIYSALHEKVEKSGSRVV